MIFRVHGLFKKIPGRNVLTNLDNVDVHRSVAQCTYMISFMPQFMFSSLAIDLPTVSYVQLIMVDFKQDSLWKTIKDNPVILATTSKLSCPLASFKTWIW